MKTKRAMMLSGILLTLLSFSSFALMDSVPDRSTTQDWLNLAGYILCGLALVLLFRAMRSPR